MLVRDSQEAKCGRCAKTEKIPENRGIKRDLPLNWASVLVHGHPSKSEILCGHCVKTFWEQFMRSYRPGGILDHDATPASESASPVVVQ